MKNTSRAPLVDDVDQPGEVLASAAGGATAMAIERAAPLSEGAPISSIFVDPFEIRDRGSEAPLDLDERPLVAVGVQEIDRHACSQVLTLRRRICRAHGTGSSE